MMQKVSKDVDSLLSTKRKLHSDLMEINDQINVLDRTNPLD